jgi:hypothetical protein
MKSKRSRKDSTNSPSADLTSILQGWTYDEDDAVRRVEAEDGREILQVRLPLGLEQYELHGRPDGKRPYKQESWLHFYRRRARAMSPEFALTDRDVERLYKEGLLYYYRYLRFFQMQEYRLCARDTRRNIKLLEFVSTFANPEQSEQLEQYRPYILRMNVMSRALHRLQRDNNIRASLRILERGIETIEELLPLEDSQVFEFEKMRSLQSLEDLRRQLSKHLPLSKEEKLEKEMAQAVEKENYEQAAILRDEIRALRQNKHRRVSRRATSSEVPPVDPTGDTPLDGAIEGGAI